MFHLSNYLPRKKQLNNYLLIYNHRFLSWFINLIYFFQVRTKDRMFESVSHLINYHSKNQLPIISAESVLILKTPVPKPFL